MMYIDSNNLPVALLSSERVEMKAHVPSSVGRGGGGTEQQGTELEVAAPDQLTVYRPTKRVEAKFEVKARRQAPSEANRPLSLPDLACSTTDFVYYPMLRAAVRSKGSQLPTSQSLPPCTCRPTAALVASPLASTSRLQLFHSAAPRYARPKKREQLIDSAVPTYSSTEALDAESAEAGPSASAVALEPTRMQMRPYQLDVINAVLGTLKEGEYTRLGVSAPTGRSSLPEQLRTDRASEGGGARACSEATVEL